MDDTNEDYDIANNKAKQLHDLLVIMVEQKQPNNDQTPLQALAIELSTDVVYAIQRMK